MIRYSITPIAIVIALWATTTSDENLIPLITEEQVNEFLNVPFWEVFEDPAQKLLDKATIAHGEALFKYQTPSTTYPLPLDKSTKKRATVDNSLSDAYHQLELRNRSQVGTKEYNTHHLESIRKSLETMKTAAEWVQIIRIETQEWRQ